MAAGDPMIALVSRSPVIRGPVTSPEIEGGVTRDLRRAYLILGERFDLKFKPVPRSHRGEAAVRRFPEITRVISGEAVPSWEL